MGIEELSCAEYWDKRYDKSNDHEWFRTFDQLRSFFDKHLPQDRGTRILHLGCGTSTLTVDLYALGYRHQTNIDFSEVAIQSMKEKYEDLHGDWRVMDVREMKLEGASFDVAIDKGTLDAMLYGSLWDPPEEVRNGVRKYVDEVSQ